MRDVMARDVVDRYPRAGIALANQVAMCCLRNIGCGLSINNLVTDLKRVGYPTTWETVSETFRLSKQAHLYSSVGGYSTPLTLTTLFY